jgi:hypothetical protein
MAGFKDLKGKQWAKELLLSINTIKADTNAPGKSSASKILIPNWIQDIYDST